VGRTSDRRRVHARQPRAIKLIICGRQRHCKIRCNHCNMRDFIIGRSGGGGVDGVEEKAMLEEEEADSDMPHANLLLIVFRGASESLSRQRCPSTRNNTNPRVSAYGLPLAGPRNQPTHAPTPFAAWLSNNPVGKCIARFFHPEFPASLATQPRLTFDSERAIESNIVIEGCRPQQGYNHCDLQLSTPTITHISQHSHSYFVITMKIHRISQKQLTLSFCILCKNFYNSAVFNDFK
jgi:hypothetical protein